MKKNFKIVKVDADYCDYLREFDNKVPYNKGEKELRPFVGILFTVDDIEYFAPLSSPKPKHKSLKNTVDLIKIDGGNLGVINFNNMIPITNKNYQIIDLETKPKTIQEIKRQNLIKLQLRWLNEHLHSSLGLIYRLYDNYKKDRLPENVKNRCCNFPLLEKKCKKYNKTSIFARIRMYF